MEYFKKLLFKRPVITILLIYSLYLIVLNYIGYFSVQNKSDIFKLLQNTKDIIVCGKVISEPYTSNKLKKFILKTSSVNDIKINEKILINAPEGYLIKYGDIINASGKLYRLSPPKGSNQFDYKKYLERNEIFYTLRMYSFEYVMSKPNIFKKLAIVFKNDIISKVDRYFLYPNSVILKSLLIGDKTYLDQNIRKVFSDSGVIHILVVSGLHVGFIGVIILFILKLFGIPLSKASILSLPFIFFYVISTGANPPALRAAVMISCIFISLALKREPLIYNSISLSALIILIFKSQNLFLASFQMSYLATLGIVFLYNKFFSLFNNPKNLVLRLFCGIISVTLSAQLALVPILIFYFQKVSLVSFLANIIIVPLIGFILSCAIIFYLSSFLFNGVVVVSAYILNTLISFIMHITIFLGSFNFSSIIVNKPSVSELFLFYIFLIIVFATKGKKRLLLSSLILTLNLLFI